MPPPSPEEQPAERVNRKPHSLPAIPAAPAWTEEIAALKDIGDDLAVALWRALRNVRIWAATAPEKRKGLFAMGGRGSREEVGYACARAPHLVEAFGTFAFLLRCPSQITSKRVAGACTQVYEWAEARALLHTGMHFAEAAAIVDPEHPTCAINAGWMCRRAVVYDRAAIWYQRGYQLAVRCRHRDLTLSREESIRALVEYGALLKDQGREDEAREYYQRAAKRAARFGRKRQAAVVLHYLLALSAEVGGFEESLDYAQQAFDLYPIQDRQIPALAHDWAFLMVRFAYYSPAVTLLELAVFRTFTPALQTLYWGTLARGMGGVRRRERFEEAEQRTLHFVGLYDEYAPAAFVNLSEGARSLGEWDLSEQYAGMAVEFARAREDVVVERYALDLLDKIATREPAPDEQTPPHADQIRIFARRLAARLRKWKAPGPSEPETP